jgi:hypothetical protein
MPWQRLAKCLKDRHFGALIMADTTDEGSKHTLSEGKCSIREHIVIGQASVQPRSSAPPYSLCLTYRGRSRVPVGLNHFENVKVTSLSDVHHRSRCCAQTPLALGPASVQANGSSIRQA